MLATLCQVKTHRQIHVCSYQSSTVTCTDVDGLIKLSTVGAGENAVVVVTQHYYTSVQLCFWMLLHVASQVVAQIKGTVTPFA